MCCTDDHTDVRLACLHLLAELIGDELCKGEPALKTSRQKIVRAWIGGEHKTVQSLALVMDPGVKGVKTHQGVEGDSIHIKLVKPCALVVFSCCINISSLDVCNGYPVFRDQSQYPAENFKTTRAQRFEKSDIGLVGATEIIGFLDDLSTELLNGLLGTC